MPLDLRSRTTLLCGVLALVIAASTLLRGRVRTVHLLFAAFAADMGLWYLSQSLYGFFGAEIWERFTALLAVFLPQFALQLFEAMIPHAPGLRPRLVRVARLLAVPVVVLVLSPYQGKPIVRATIVLYVFALLTAGLLTLGQRGKRSGSRATERRVQFLVLIGALACLASVADFIWFLGAELPPIGAVLSVVFLFVLAQALRHERLLDMYELFGRFIVATAVAFLLAGVFFVLVGLIGRFNTMYLNAVLFAIVLLVLYEPLRARVEEQIQRLVFRERFDLDRSIREAKRRLVHTLQVEDMGAIVMSSLEQSRRATVGALYLRDPEGTGFDKLTSFGPGVPARVEAATVRALLDATQHGPVDLEAIERESEQSAVRVIDRAAVLTASEALGGMRRGVLLAIRDKDKNLIGIFALADRRVRDAFSPEELVVLQDLAAQIGVVVENSRVYTQMKNRDRLMTLGQMAAGLAHEIRNPLGAIKGAAQLLAEPTADGREIDPSSREFLGVILEEVDRLDRVLGSILDYARPNPGAPVPTDVNAVAKQTLRIVANEPGAEDVIVETTLDPELPRVAIDPEQLRQVLINLYRNAVQAMKGRGKITVSTRVRLGLGTRPGVGSEEPFVELTVADNGPGISQIVLRNLFQPFFSTKDKGTGLGLATSKNLIESAGGRIEVRSYEGKGSTFSVVLPATSETIGTPTPAPVSRASKHLAASLTTPVPADAPPESAVNRSA